MADSICDEVKDNPKKEIISLKDCPFCGNSVDINSDSLYPLVDDDGIWECGCVNLDCAGSVLGDSKNDAIKNWNKRHKPLIIMEIV